MKKTIILGLFFVATTLLVAEPAITSTSLNFVAATTLEAKVTLTEAVKIPLLQGSSPLTSGNNLRLSGGIELSPVSVNGILGATLTPIAFLQFSAGASVGSGWNIPIANGLRMNEPVLDGLGVHTGERELTGSAFDGIVWSAKAGGTFQFDFAAIFPGDWNHVVIQSYHGVKYRANTAAGADDSWLYEADGGENRNGLAYYGNGFLGYQMPLFVSMAGILLEYDLKIYGTKGSDAWGENLGMYTVGPMVNFSITDRLSVAVLAQMQSSRKWTEETADYKFYQDRRVVKDNPLELIFYRAALNATWQLR